MNEPFVERDGDGQSFVQTQRLARTDFDAISGDVHVRILCTRAVGAGKHISANIRGALRKDDVRTGGLSGDVPSIAGHVPIELVVVLEKTKRIGNRIFYGNVLCGIVGIRNINLELTVMALAAGLVLESAAAHVDHALNIEKQRVIQPLRRNVFNRDRSIKPVPGPADKMRLNTLGDIDRAVRQDDRFGLEVFDAQLAGAESRSCRENKSTN